MRQTGNVATFRTVRDATWYAEAIAQPGNWSANIVRKGRTVTFDLAAPEGADVVFYDFLERVGYYGSSQSGRAQLNGVNAPISY